jgi:hypothetical protein
MVDHYIVTYTDDILVHLEIVTTINQKLVSGLKDASPIAMVTANVTVIPTPTGTNTTPESESVSASKIGGRPTGITKRVIDGRKSLVVDAV